ncbi:MAG: universal stress protein [Planctomycetota bacterium]
MSQSRRVLFPTDLSENSLSALDMATNLAKQHDALLSFVYVTSPPLPEEAMYGGDFESQQDLEIRKQFEQVRPTDDTVTYEHLFLQGNPGPMIVSASASAMLCVMSTHGRSGIMRLLMGSVAQYVLRYAKCPVILTRGLGPQISPSTENQAARQFVTEVMHQVAPVHSFEKIEDVIAQLKRANETGVPVIDDLNRCIGILTTTDIDRYRSLKARYNANDPTVVEEMFETNKYGNVRCDNQDFESVKRHMTEQVISVRTNHSIQDAMEQFEAHPDIHHLVVLDDDDRPVGLLDSTHLAPVAANET